MAEVVIEGIYLGAEPRTKTFNGESKTRIELDIYQKDSKAKEKTVTLTTDDMSLLSTLTTEYDMGSIITVKATINAYQNTAYYRLQELIN